MERSLNLEAIRLALGEGEMLPSPEELQQLLADTEIHLFIGDAEMSDDLLASGWYLHAVGSARRALDLYPLDRQRRAHQLSAHIFDLSLASRERAYVERLQLGFAAQVGYLRGDLTPNAAAVYRRLQPHRTHLVSSPGSVSLELGTAMLALDRRTLFERIQREIRPEANSVRATLETDDLTATPYGSADRVVNAIYELIVHLTYNRPERLARARELLVQAIDAPGSQGDLDSRWVAAHLRDFADDLGTSSVWSVLPPDVPSTAASAMTLGDPPALLLWPPQVELFAGVPSPLDPAVRRLILSLPTSAGKTLISQYMITANVAQGLGSVCVVVPTHSLAREVRRDLDRRLSVLAKEAQDGGPLGIALPLGPSNRVVVMTPEKLAALLRNDPTSVLAEFSLFVIDEAHLVGDRERGWVLESALSFLHQQTIDTPHRIILLSAALGNRNHFIAWMTPEDDEVTAFHSDWRGPRRAHAIYTTVTDDSAAHIEEPQRKNQIPRRIRPLHGQITVRTGAGAGYVQLTTTEPVGELVEKIRDTGLEYDSGRTTARYRMRVPIAQYLGQHGPVLTIEGTKQGAQRFATALAEELEDDPDSGPLVSLASLRLGENHPLVSTLRRGVGFHHAALPEDIQAELEDAVRFGGLQYLVSTTTLIEGINLPVRSVLIGTRGYQTQEGPVVTLDAAKLLNAIGRAGRAGKETEGWIVLSVEDRFRPEQFRDLDRQDVELDVTSRLTTEDALAALAEFEDLIRQGQDAVFEYSAREVADFISHIWFVASSLEELSGGIQEGETLENLEHTLAWQQLDEPTRQRWRNVSTRAFASYVETPPDRRRRWARTGTSIPTAARFEHLVDAILPALEHIDLADPTAVMAAIMADDRIDEILELPESPFRPFRPRRNAPRADSIGVDIPALILDWLGGMTLPEIAENHLADILDEDFRYEQLSEFTTGILEHLLPWVLATIISWLEDRGVFEPPEHLADLPAYVRYGVDSPVALSLMTEGVRSRRLAHVVARQAPAEVNVREWLAGQDLPSWREAFEASSTELADLLVFTRARDAQVTARILAGEPVTVDLLPADGHDNGALALGTVEELAPQRLALWSRDEMVGVVPATIHEDLNRLLATGLPLDLSLDYEEGLPQLTIRIQDPDRDGQPAG